MSRWLKCTSTYFVGIRGDLKWLLKMTWGVGTGEWGEGCGGWVQLVSVSGACPAVGTMHTIFVGFLLVTKKQRTAVLD